MSAHIIDGKAAAARLTADIAVQVARLKQKNIRPGLAVVLVGNDAASAMYVRNKARQTVAVGMHSAEYRLAENASQVELLDLIAKLNAAPDIDGILVQLPLPRQADANAVIEAIDPAKDVDSFHPLNAGRLFTGLDGPKPCTPLGSLMLVKAVRADLSGLHAVVVGRSNIVGKPMAQLLLNENCTVTIAHSRTQDLPGMCRSADILIAAAGKPEMIRSDWIKPGAIVIDVGINRVPNPNSAEGKSRLIGDVAFDEAIDIAGAISPVPGGVGPMTIACLLHNTLQACLKRRAEY